MTTVTQLIASDTLAYAGSVATNYARLTYLGANTGASARTSFLYFNRPFPIGATIISATLNLRQRGTASGGSRTLTVARIASSWKVAGLTNNNAPGVSGATATLTQGDSTTDGRLWAINVTALMQSVSDGAGWFGFKVSGSIATTFTMYSSDAPQFQPTIDIEWSDAPDAPSILAPSNGRAVSVARPVLRFDFTDISGNTAMQGFELQMNVTNVWTAPSVTSGVVASNIPEWLVNFDVAAAATWFWRVRVKDGAGIWSAWSVAASFTRTAKPVVTITNPPAGIAAPVQSAASTVTAGGTVAADTYFSTITAINAAGETLESNEISRLTTGATSTVTFNWAAVSGATGYRIYVTGGLTGTEKFLIAVGAVITYVWTGTPAIGTADPPALNSTAFVSESSPPISWTAAGQVAYQLFIADPIQTTKILWTSGKVTSADNTVTVPVLRPAILAPGGSYSLTVRVWDGLTRESTPGDPVYFDAVRTFTFNLSATVAPVTAFTVVGAAPRPDAILGWTRSTAPDFFTILRDGKVIDSLIEPADLLVSGTTYRYTDYGASPRMLHTWSVVAVVNGISSASNPTATNTLLPEGIWLSKPDGSSSVCIMGGPESFTIEESEDSSVHYPLGAANGVLITQAIHGRVGQVNGYLHGGQAGLETVTLASWVAAFTALRATHGQTLSLVLSDTAMDVFIYNTLSEPAMEFGDEVPVSFNFCELL